MNLKELFDKSSLIIDEENYDVGKDFFIFLFKLY